MKKLGLLLLLLILTVINVNNVMASTSSDSMRGYWKFDETSTGGSGSVVDSSGDGMNGTPSGATGANNKPQPNSAVPSSISFPDARSLNFDGTDDYVDVGTSTNLNITNNFTIALWVKLNVNKDEFIISRRTTGGCTSTNYGLIHGYGGLAANTVALYSESYTGTNPGTKLTSTIIDTNWHHVAFTYDGSTVKGYLDATTGTADVTSAKVFSFSTTAANLFIGDSCPTGVNTDYYSGGLDDLRIYNRALSSTEVASLASGTHTTATWSGSTSTNVETAGNWNINAVPDLYTKLIINPVTNQPLLTANISAYALVLNSGASFNNNGFSITYTDGGGLTDNNQVAVASSSPSNNILVYPSTTETPTCNDKRPEKTPELFEINSAGTFATLSFKTVEKDTTGYAFSYGYNEKADNFGDKIDYSGPQWLLNHTIWLLNPNTTYYFKVQAINGCMAGEWSNVMKVKTNSTTISQTFATDIDKN